jgi:hypothetical protein
MSLPRIAVLALGGTIAMVKGDQGGVRPGLTADDLIAAVPGLGEIATLRAETISTIGSSDLRIESVIAVAKRIRALTAAGEIDGAVVTQGTDTLEESVFLQDLLLDSAVPVVVAGAMRNPLSVSHDGPGNLLAAVRTAADAEVRARSRELGVLVVLLDTIHAAIDVAKTDTARIDAFHSRLAGPVGVLVEDRVRMIGTPNLAHKSAFHSAVKAAPRLVGQFGSGRADDPGYRGERRAALGDGGGPGGVRLSRAGDWSHGRRPRPELDLRDGRDPRGADAGGNGRADTTGLSAQEDLRARRLRVGSGAPGCALGRSPAAAQGPGPADTHADGRAGRRRDGAGLGVAQLGAEVSVPSRDLVFRGVAETCINKVMS